jgi:hypothetical protein
MEDQEAHQESGDGQGVSEAIVQLYPVIMHTYA